MFLLVLHHSTPDILPELAKRVLQEVATQPLQIDGKTINVTLSGGYISLPIKHNGKQHIYWESALKLADHLLYQAKAQGRNQIIGLTSLNIEPEQPQLSDQQLLQLLENAQCSTLTIKGPAEN